MFEILIFYGSFVLIVYQLIKFDIPFDSVLYPFLFFSFIYISVPALYFYYSSIYTTKSLIYAINQDSLSSAFFQQAMIFSLTYLALFSSRFKRLVDFSNVNHKPYLGVISSHFFLLIYPVAIFFNYLYPWGDFGQVKTFMHSISNFLLSVEIVLYASIALMFRSKRIGNRFFIFVTILILFESFIYSARTPLFIVLFIFIGSYQLRPSNVFKWLPFFILILLLVLLQTLLRNDIGFSFSHILFPFLSEGLWGSYGYFQAYVMNVAGYIPDQSFIFPFFEVFVSLIPFSLFEIDFVDISAYAQMFIKALNENILDQRFQPMGGFFYLTEMFIAFGNFAPILFFLLLILFLVFVRKVKGEIGLLLLSSSFLIVKSPIANNVKLYLLWAFIFLLIYIFKILILSSSVKRK